MSNTNTSTTTADRRNNIATAALKKVNQIEPVGAKKFYDSVSGEITSRTQAQRALEGMLPSMTQYVLALKVASPELTRVQVKFDLDLPVQSTSESDEKYAARLAEFITSSLMTGTTFKHTGKDAAVTKAADWDREQHLAQAVSLVSASLTLTKVETVDGFKQPKSYRGFVGDDVAAKSVNQLHKELRQAYKNASDESKVAKVQYSKQAAPQQNAAD